MDNDEINNLEYDIKHQQEYFDLLEQERLKAVYEVELVKEKLEVILIDWRVQRNIVAETKRKLGNLLTKTS